MPTTAYSYIRFSTPEQAKGDSLKRQLEASQDYADKNGLVLDTTLRDLGKSAFKGVNSKAGKLGEFLARVDSGEIKSGSFLIVESLDRLSREAVMTALPRFIALIESGITVVTLGSSPQKYDSASIAANPYVLIGSLLEMVRANEESKRKSDRVGAAWSRKKREAGITGVITKRAPAWLEVVEGKFRPVKGRAELIRRIFKMTVEGYGKGAIAKTFNEEKTPSFGDSGWHASYVQKILTNRAVLGEFQPMSRKGGKREPDGHPVPNYFPVIVTEDIFLAAQRARKRRQKTGGRPSEGSHALFTGLIKCAHCDGSVVSVTKNKAKGWVYLVCDNARRGRGCEYRSWGAAEFETIFLDWVVDFDFSAQSPNKELAALEKTVDAADVQVEQIALKIDHLITTLENTGSPTIAARIKALEFEKAQRTMAYESAKAALIELREKADIISANQKDFQQTVKDPDSRERLKNELKKRVKEITMVFNGNKNEVYGDGSAFARVSLFNGETHDIFRDGEAVIYKDGRKYVSEGLAY